MIAYRESPRFSRTVSPCSLVGYTYYPHYPLAVLNARITWVGQSGQSLEQRVRMLAGVLARILPYAHPVFTDKTGATRTDILIFTWG
jgi:hypothetical protein